MGLHSSKIDRDRAKNVKRKILKNYSFCVEIVFLILMIMLISIDMLNEETLRIPKW